MRQLKNYFIGQKQKKPKKIYSQKTATTRDGFGQGLVKAAEENSQLVALSADLTESLRMSNFAHQFPQRFIQVGVAEQNLIGVAAGLALANKIPFAGSFAVFSPGRTHDQIRASVAYSNLNVKIVGGHGGLCNGADGATHQALEDIAMMQSLANMKVIVPADFNQAYLATLALSQDFGPAYLRIGKEKIPNITSKNNQFTIGKAQILRQGTDISLIACGTMVYQALLASQQLAKNGISAQVINMHTLKPLDTDTIIRAAQQTKAILSLEEHQLIGGLGSRIAQILAVNSKNLPRVDFDMIGVDNKFGQSGNSQQLFKEYGLDVSSIVRKSLKLITL